MRRRFEYKDRELEDFIIRFYPAGNYTWIVPEGCFSVDVFLVGGGGSGRAAGGGGGGNFRQVVIPRPSNLITKAGKTEKLLL